jgi:integrase
MASISTDGKGNRIVQFIAGDGKRRSIRLGKLDLKTARDVARRVDALNVAMIAGQVIGRDLAEWLGIIGETLHKKLVTVGLIAERAGKVPVPTLGDFLAEFVAKFAGSKESTLATIRVAAARLTAYFGADAPLDGITAGQADNWLTWMKLDQKYAGPTIGRTIKHAKRFFTSAVRLKILAENPFGHLRSRKQTNNARQEFITHETTTQALDALPDAEWRLIFALSRFGGLRCPSEHLALTWNDIDWERDRFRAVAPKTGERWVPIFAELRPYLEDCWELAATDSVHVISRRRACAQRWGMLLERILRRAGIVRWERIFHNLRASRETELMATFSSASVCRWLGNSIKVADAHYLMALESDFARAAKVGVNIHTALHNPVQQSETNGDKPAQTNQVDDAETLEIAGNAKEHPEACKSQGG